MPNLGLVLMVVGVLAFWLLGAYNRLTRLRGAISGTFPALEIQLRKRQSLLRHLGASILPDADAVGVGGARAPLFEPDDDEDAAAAAAGEAAPTQPAALGDDTREQAALALAASETARAATERLHKRAVLRTPMQQLQESERALEVALDALSEALRTAALEAPLDRPQADLLDRLKRLQQPITYCAEAYNQAVAAYNEALDVFPTSLAARIFRFAPALPLNLQQAATPTPPARDSL